jgi:hypothetical protein
MSEESAIDILSGFLPEDEFAKGVGKSKKTLRRWDKAGLGPPRTKLGRAIYYNLAAAKIWLEAGGVVAAGPTNRRTPRGGGKPHRSG